MTKLKIREISGKLKMRKSEKNQVKYSGKFKFSPLKKFYMRTSHLCNLGICKKCWQHYNDNLHC